LGIVARRFSGYRAGKFADIAEALRPHFAKATRNHTRNQKETKVMETVATRKNRRRRIGLLALLAGVIALGVTLMPMTAGAVHGGPFELDGNALDDNGSGAVPDDWGTLFPTYDSSTDLGHSFVTDKGESGLEPDDGYGSGLTKDTQDVPNWSAVTGAISPEKDDILHAYAATYVDANDDQLLYFGQDRAPKPNGSTAMGFWFFQDQVGPDGTGGFTGEHKNGDVLITSDMTNGGSVSVVNIFRWQAGGLVSVASLANAECGESLPPAIEALGCAIANESGPIDVPWDYPFQGQNDPVPANIFFEGGINLSNLFPNQAIPCFSSFLANTRTSPSETADLKDFVAGTIDTCGTITIKKDSVPDSAQDFGFAVTGDGLSPFSLDDDGDDDNDLSSKKVFTGLEPGDYSVSELDLPLDWTNSSLHCDPKGPGTDADDEDVDPAGSTAVITLGLAGNVECTYVNKLKPRVKLVKELDPSDDAGRFDLALNDTAFDNGGQGFGHGDTTGFVTVEAGDMEIAESAHAGTSADKYASSVSCDSGKGTAMGTSHDFSVDYGESVTCTFKNHRERGKLIVRKVVVNDNGGSKAAEDFSFSVNDGNAMPFEDDAENELTVDAGTYDVTEPPVAGYETSYDKCNDIVVPDGGSATCTITNDDKPAKLVVIKHVVNDHGGTLAAADFHIDVTGDDALPASFAGAEAPGTNVTLDAGSYSVAEMEHPGYAANYSPDCAGSIANGETKTCTITNNDKPAKLVVVKHVVNDHGGTLAAADFHIDVTGDDALPASFAGAEAPGTEVTLDAGAYDVTETEHPSYAASYSADCSGSIANGETKTCTITNDDKAAKLVVIKHVVNDHGGPLRAADFDISVTGTDAPPDAFPGAEAPGTEVGIGAGAYNVTETEDPGYEASYSTDCSGSIANGETKTCTITNDDKPAKLVVVKHVVNDHGGKLGAADFELSVTGTDASPASFPGAEAPGTDVTLDAGAYDVTETELAGYAASYSADCTGSIANGETKTCTITNDDDIAPTVDVTKDANVESINEPGGDVIFMATVWNTSHEAVTLTSLVDSVYGNLDKDDVGNHSWVSSLCDTGGTLAATDGTKGGPDTYACTFVGAVKGEGPATHENEVTAVVTDDEDDTATDKDTATVAIKDVPPPPPPPPAPQIDLSVTKADAPDPAKLNGQIGYTMLVRNAGPSTATGVTLADPLPAGTSFVSVSTTQGTCSFGGGLVQCSLGTIPAGGSVSVTLVVKATRAGVLTNEVTVVGQEPESNTANNRATAPTLVLTPLLPPKPKPVCSTLTVGPKSLRVGKRSTIAATVKNRGKAVKGAKVRVRGAGIAKGARTNARGKARITVRPSRPGIVVVSVPQKLMCGSKRIGVVGVFEPPVTG
jgi:uncharacterized repeat protein (TIGR01451 family)